MLEMPLYRTWVAFDEAEQARLLGMVVTQRGEKSHQHDGKKSRKA